MRHIYAVRGVIGGMGAPASHRRQVVALAAADLRVEDAQQRRLEIFVRGTVKGDFIRIHHPIEIAPDFAAVEMLRAVLFRQAADRFDHSERHRHVRVVLVGEVVRVHDLGPGCLEQQHQVFHRLLVGAILYDLAWIIQDHLGRILADHSGLSLLFEPDQAHLVVGIILVQIISR